MSRDERTTISRPQELVELDNLFAEGVDYVDKHLQEIRYGIYGIAVVGSVIAIRSLRLFGRFRRTKDIPRSYIKKNANLQGIIRRVDPETKILMVEHIPIIQIRQSKPGDLLPVALSGVRMGALGYQWLDIAARNQQIGFTLLAVNSKNEVECIVTQNEGWLKKRCLNTQIVQLGLGQVAPFQKELQKNKLYKDLYHRLLQLESKAVKDRNGVWSSLPPTTYWWDYFKILNIAFQKIKHSLRRTPTERLPA